MEHFLSVTMVFAMLLVCLGGPGFSTGAANCTHAGLRAAADFRASFDTEGVAQGAALPADVNDYVGVSGSETSRYENTMGVSTGSYYAADGRFYEQIASYTSSEAEPLFFSKAEVINHAFSEDGLIYGEDYSLIRLYNYHEIDEL